MTPSRLTFRIIIELVAHYDLELHQMNVKTIFLNRKLVKMSMEKHKGFVMEDKENLGYPLKKCIYGLNQASRLCHLKFDKTICNFRFCIHAKFKSGRGIFLMLCVENILLADSDKNMLLATKS